MRIKLVKRKNPMKKSEEKYYANPVNLGKKTLKDIAKDIAGRSSLTRGDIENVLSNFIDRLPSYLRDGFSVQLSDFGTMRLTLSSEGSLTEKAFNIEKIKPRVTFTPGTELKAALRDNSYETVKDKDKKESEGGGGTPSHP
jgi:putative DNA-binding protein